MDEAIAYKPAEAAKIIGVSLPTMYAFLHRAVNPCPSFRIGCGDSAGIRVPRIGLELWVMAESGISTKEAERYFRIKNNIKSEVHDNV